MVKALCASRALSGSNVSFDASTVTETDAALDALPVFQLALALDWDAINGVYAESVADGDYLATDYICSKLTVLSWAGWTVSGS